VSDKIFELVHDCGCVAAGYAPSLVALDNMYINKGFTLS
jgi:hypothetical protein